MNGRLFLIPTYLSPDNSPAFISGEVHTVIKNTTHYAAENIRTARRFISSLKLGVDIPSLQFHLLDKRFRYEDCRDLFDVVTTGHDLGVISEAGLPGIADPGHLAVRYAHRHHIEVIPLPGASSILLGIVSSGFSGQQFTFHGYLPIDKGERSGRILDMEKQLAKSGYTQIFMETPFRNMALLDQLIEILHPRTLLFIGVNITGRDQKCVSKPIDEWKSDRPNLHKIPVVFALGI